MAPATMPPDYSAGEPTNAVGSDNLDEALRFIAKPITDSQRAFIRCAVDQVLAEPVLAPDEAVELRVARISGFAVRTNERPKHGPLSIRIAGTATPTNPYLEALDPNECVQLAAGALLPARVDTLIPTDQVGYRSNSILMRMPVLEHSQLWMTTRALAMPHGVVFGDGHRLANTDLAVLASLGIYEVSIRRTLRVGYLIVDRPQGRRADSTSTAESHRINLYSSLARMNVEILDLGDVHKASADMIASLTDACDVVIVIGATDTEMACIGSYQYRVQIHSQPLIYANYARINKTVFLSLPKLPIQVMVALHHVVIPLIRTLRGEKQTLPFKYRLQRPV